MAHSTAHHAVENNFLFIAPALAMAGTAWSAYDVYTTYQEKGTEAALLELAQYGAIWAVTLGTGKVIYKVGNKVYHSANMAWSAAVARSTKLSEITQKVSTGFGALKSKFAKSSNKLKFEQASQNTAEKVSTNPPAKSALTKNSGSIEETFTKKTVEKSGKIHKNSLEYKGETHVYKIFNENGIYKIGESAQGLNKYGLSKRAIQQARKLQREAGKEFRTEIIEVFPGKREAREAETRLIQKIRQELGPDALPGNKGKH